MKRNILIAVFFVAVLGFVAFLFYLSQSKDRVFIENTVRVDTGDDATFFESTPIVPETTFSKEGWRRYENEKFFFSLEYPDALQAREYKEFDGALSVVFESSAREGFQIYVVPYEEDHVTQRQFALDVPSGVMEDPVELLIDGTQATMFFSRNSVMGDTREVWFIKNGYLYEVVTYKDLDEWLSQIMSTWKFAR